MIIELCRGTYSATQHDGVVTIFAIGSHPTTGYRVYFQPLRMPNAYELLHDRPQGIVGQLVTPFAVHISYRSAQKLKVVLVKDVAGNHEVPVAEIPEIQLEAAHGGGGLPGPFAEEGENTSALVVSTATGTGSSSSFSFEEAFQNAISDARNHLPHIPDLPVKAEVTSIRALVGGFGGFHSLVVDVIASL